MVAVALLIVRVIICRYQNFVSLHLLCAPHVARRFAFEKLVTFHPQFRVGLFHMANFSHVVGELVAQTKCPHWNIEIQMFQSQWHSRMSHLFCRAASDVCSRSMPCVVRYLRGGRNLRKVDISQPQICLCVEVLVNVSLILHSILSLMMIYFVQQLH